MVSFEKEFNGLLPYAVTVHRLTRTHVNSQLKASVSASPVSTGVPCKIDLLSGGIAGTPVGTIEKATHQLFTGPTRDIKPKDVIEVTDVGTAVSGVQVGDYFVVGAVDAPLNSHVEVIMEYSQNKTKEGSPDA